MRISLSDWFTRLAEAPMVRRVLDVFFAARSRLHLVWLGRLDSVRAQARVLSRLVRRAASTPFGIAHDFARIRTEDDFRRLVPLRSPNELKRQAEFRTGSALALSGSVPVTADLLAHHRRALRSALALAVDSRPRAGLLSRPVAWLGDAFPLEGDEGLEQAHRLRLPRLLRAAVSPSGHGPAGLMIGPMPRIRAALAANPDPVAVLAWHGESAEVPGAVVVEMLARAEATVAVRSPRDGAFRLLAEHGAYFEFVPADRLGERAPPRLNLEEVALGEDYELVVSSPSAWACRTGWGVRFSQLRPPLFELVPLPSAAPARAVVPGGLAELFGPIPESAKVLAR